MDDAGDAELARRREVGDVMRHDMRTAVGVGRGYLTMLLRHYDDLTPEQRARVVEGVGKAFDRLDEFSRRVLVDEKLLTHVDPLQCGDVDVESFVAEVRTSYPGVVVEVAPGVPASVWADPVMLLEAVDNLVANALVAAPPGTFVRVTVGGGAGTLRIAVRDSGDALEETDRSVLFERYGRAGHSRRSGPSGMGLGLSIVRRIVEAHGGTCGVTTGDGTTFWVEMPVSPDGALSPRGHAEDTHA